jgi:hypothetical protein
MTVASTGLLSCTHQPVCRHCSKRVDAGAVFLSAVGRAAASVWRQDPLPPPVPAYQRLMRIARPCQRKRPPNNSNEYLHAITRGCLFSLRRVGSQARMLLDFGHSVWQSAVFLSFPSVFRAPIASTRLHSARTWDLSEATRLCCRSVRTKWTAAGGGRETNTITFDDLSHTQHPPRSLSSLFRISIWRACLLFHLSCTKHRSQLAFPQSHTNGILTLCTGTSHYPGHQTPPSPPASHLPIWHDHGGDAGDNARLQTQPLHDASGDLSLEVVVATHGSPALK